MFESHVIILLSNIKMKKKKKEKKKNKERKSKKDVVEKWCGY